MNFQRCVLPISVLLLCFPHASHSATKKGCSLNIFRNPNEKLLPLFAYNNSRDFSFIVPEHGHINLNHGDGITLSCPGRKNSLPATKSNSGYATCIQGTTLKISKNSFDFDELLCERSVQSEVQKTEVSCGNRRGKIMNIGHQVTESYFRTLFEVCYDEEEGTTLYTMHTVNGKEIKYASKTSERPTFSTSGLGPRISANVAYKKAFQKSTFNRLLGSAQAAERYITSKSFLARGHLSPDADFLFASSQFTTYYYINTSPQWQVINGANWVSLENAIRRTAEHYQDTFTIITGTYDILKLPDDDGNEISIFLVSKNKLPVPKFIWKIIYHEDSRKGIALVSLNNPFINKITQDLILCEDICEQSGWASDKWMNTTRGYVYCCDINEFTRTVRSVPRINVSGLLTGILS
ncbi:unnamed protein product [Phaedon cochleariae]|uniref:Uncharacterized protein n=1 Tax=Phaedon cochleariae TaxID=80249 RepID=A0A9P0GQK0_PHACE|nr:unnamed protein product [Phaedon cochleariae]